MPTQSVRRVKSSSKLTHSELHAMVMMETVNSTGSFRPADHSSFFSYGRRTHRELHELVFSAELVSTPSGTWKLEIPNLLPQPVRRSPSETFGSRRMSVSRAQARHPIPPSPSPSPSRRLPPPPAGGSRLSTAFEDMNALMKEHTSPIRGLPATPRSLPPRRDPYGEMDTLLEEPTPSPLRGLPPTPRSLPHRDHNSDNNRRSVYEQRPSTSPSASLSRSSSMALPRSVGDHDSRLDRSHSASTIPGRPVPQKRDSLVSQRVRAFNSCKFISLSASNPTLTFYV